MKRFLVRTVATLGVAGVLVGVSPSVASSTRVVGDQGTKGPIEVVDVGFSTLAPEPDDFIGYQNTVAGILRNTSTKVASLIDFDFVVEDESGKELARASENHPYLLPGAELVVAAPLLSTETEVEPATVRLEVTTQPDLYSRKEWDRSYSPGAVREGLGVDLEDLFTLSDVRYHSDGGRSDQGSVLGMVQNAGDATILQSPGVDVTCALLRQEQIIGGATDFVPAMPAGEAVGFQAGPTIGGLEPDDIRCNVTPGSGRTAGPDDAKIAVVESVVASYPTTTGPAYHAAVVLRNDSTKYAALNAVRFDFYDSGGRFVGRDDGYPSGPVLPGGGEAFASAINIPPYRLDGTPSSVVIRVGDVHFQTRKEIRQSQGYVPTEADWALSNVRYDDNNQGVSTSDVIGTVENRARTARRLDAVDCVLLRGGQLLGGASDSLLDEVAPGGTVEFKALVANSLPSDEVRCVVSGG